MNSYKVNIYTDGSSHNVSAIGAWAAILLADKDKIILKNEVQNTTHNRMELLAVIKAIEYADDYFKNSSLIVYTDSQYVFRIPERKDRLKKNHFLTKRGVPVQNQDLVKILVSQIESHSIDFVKVKAHQQQKVDYINYNAEVDRIARQIVREAVKRKLRTTNL